MALVSSFGYHNKLWDVGTRSARAHRTVAALTRNEKAGDPAITARMQVIIRKTSNRYGLAQSVSERPDTPVIRTISTFCLYRPITSSELGLRFGGVRSTEYVHVRSTVNEVLHS